MEKARVGAGTSNKVLLPSTNKNVTFFAHSLQSCINYRAALFAGLLLGSSRKRLREKTEKNSRHRCSRARRESCSMAIRYELTTSSRRVNHFEDYIRLPRKYPNRSRAFRRRRRTCEDLFLRETANFGISLLPYIHPSYLSSRRP